MSHMLDLTAFNPDLFGGEDDKEKISSESPETSSTKESTINKRAAGDSGNRDHTSLTINEKESPLSSDNESLPTRETSSKILKTSSDSESESDGDGNGKRNNDKRCENMDDDDEDEDDDDESDDSLSKFMKKQKEEQAAQNLVESSHSRFTTSGSRSRNKSISRTRKNSNADIHDVIEEDPELYGVRRSGRSRKEPERLNIAVDEDSEDSDRPLAERRRKITSRRISSSRQQKKFKRSSGRSAVKGRPRQSNHARYYDDDDDDDDNEDDDDDDSTGFEQEYSEEEDSSSFDSEEFKPLKNRKRKASSKYLKRSTRSAQGGISYKEASSDSDDYRKKKRAGAGRATVFGGYGAGRTLTKALHSDSDSENISGNESDGVGGGTRATLGRQLSSVDADPFGEPETEGIERVLNYRIGRKTAVGDKTTVYNVEENGDPNVDFDATIETGEIQFFIKWRGWSHLHNTWESLESLEMKNVEGMKKIHNFRANVEELREWKSMASPEEIEMYNYKEELNEELLREQCSVERIISQTKATNAEGYVDYLCKFKGLPYGECTWEDGGLIAKMFPKAVENYEVRQRSQRIPSKTCRVLKIRPKFVPYREQAEYLGGAIEVETDDESTSEEPLKLRDYQLDGINWLAHAWTRGNSVILADEMGLGKTIQTIGFLSYLSHEHQCYGPFLLVVPLSTVMGWKGELDRWAPEMNAILYLGDAESRKFIRQFEWYHPNRRLKFNILITTYELLLKDKTYLAPLAWAVLAVDEAHRLKNDDSLLYKALIDFETNTRLLITGTPLQNSLRELWALLHFIMPHKFDDWKEFEARYGGSSAKTTGFRGLHQQLEPYLLRRVKKDVEKSLPSKTEQILRVEMSRLQKQYYKWILTKNYKALTKGIKGSCSSFINIVMELKKCCNHPILVRPEDQDQIATSREDRLTQLVKSSGKMMLLDKLLVRLKDTGHRVLIFSQMVRMLDLLAEYLTLRTWNFQRLDGTVRGDTRKQAMDHFNSEHSQDFCFLLSTRAGGLGVNLATADTVIIFDSDWNPQNDLQAQARAHRIGQTRQVSVYRLVHKSSVEEDIIERAKKKMVLDHLVIQRMDTTGRTVLNKRLGCDSTAKSSNPFNKEELTQILKFGAQELFGEPDGDEEDPEVDVDDILERAETRQTDDTDSGAASDLLSQFKVVTFDNLEDEEILITNEGRQRKGAGGVREKAGSPSPENGSTWEEIIPETTRKRMEQEEAEQRLMELELGPRQRKTVQLLNYGPKDKDKESSEDESSSSDEDTGRRGRGRPGRSVDPRARGFSDKELRSLVRALRKFASPLARLEAVAAEAELQEKSATDLRAVIETILNGCREAMTAASSSNGGGVSSAAPAPDVDENTNVSISDLGTTNGTAATPSGSNATAGGKRKAAVFQLGRVSITAKSLLQTDDLLPLHTVLQNLDREPRRNFRVAFPTKPVAWDCVWDEVDDSALLIGIWEYGMDNWEAIKEDPDLGLRSKILREGFLKPQATHLRTRAEYLLKLMAKKSSQTATSNKSSRQKKSGRPRGTGAAKDTAAGNILNIKSKEFISSESSDSSDDEIDARQPIASLSVGGLSKKMSGKSSKRTIKRKGGSDGAPIDAKKKRVISGSKKRAPGVVHLTAEKDTDSGPEKTTAESDKLTDSVFNECKEKLRAMRKVLKKLQETPGGDREAMSGHLLKIGDHISSLIRANSCSKDEQRIWRNNLWIFVSYFTESDKGQLHKLYKRAHKKREESKKGVSKHQDSDERGSIKKKSHSHHTHHSHHKDKKDKEQRRNGPPATFSSPSKTSISERSWSSGINMNRQSSHFTPASSPVKSERESYGGSGGGTASTYLEHQQQRNLQRDREWNRGPGRPGASHHGASRYNNSYNRRGGPGGMGRGAPHPPRPFKSYNAYSSSSSHSAGQYNSGYGAYN